MKPLTSALPVSDKGFRIKGDIVQLHGFQVNHFEHGHRFADIEALDLPARVLNVVNHARSLLTEIGMIRNHGKAADADIGCDQALYADHNGFVKGLEIG